MIDKTFYMPEIDSAIRVETKEVHLLKQVLANQKLLLTTFAKFFDPDNDDWTEKEKIKMAEIFEKAIKRTDELIED